MSKRDGEAMHRLGANMLRCDECGNEHATRSMYWVVCIDEDDNVNAFPCCGVECGRKFRDRSRKEKPGWWTLCDPNNNPMT